MEIQDFRSYMTIGAHIRWEEWDAYIESAVRTLDREDLLRLLRGRELFHRCMQEGDSWISTEEETEVRFLIDSALMWAATDKFEKV